MKIYHSVTLNPDGQILHEDSFNYAGKVTLCKKGRLGAEREAKKQAERSFQLQLEIFQEQKKQLAKLDTETDTEFIKEAMRKKRILQGKMAGRRSTILTGPQGLQTLAPIKRATLGG